MSTDARMIDNALAQAKRAAVDPAGEAARHEEYAKAQHAKILTIVVAALLHEKAIESDVREELRALMAFRHNQLHCKEGSTRNVVWTDCGNENCVRAKNLLERCSRPEVFVNPLTKDMLVRNFELAQDSAPDGTLRVWLVPRKTLVNQPVIITP